MRTEPPDSRSRRRPKAIREQREQTDTPRSRQSVPAVVYPRQCPGRMKKLEKNKYIRSSEILMGRSSLESVSPWNQAKLRRPANGAEGTAEENPIHSSESHHALHETVIPDHRLQWPSHGPPHDEVVQESREMTVSEELRLLPGNLRRNYCVWAGLRVNGQERDGKRTKRRVGPADQQRPKTEPADSRT